MKTKPGVYRHHGGGKYRALFTMIDSTNGPDEGRVLVCYVSMADGKIYSRAEREFHEEVFKEPDSGQAYGAYAFQALLQANPDLRSRPFAVVPRFKFEGEA